MPFINSRKHRLKAPLTTTELLKQRKLVTGKVQLQYSDTETFKINQKQLNVKEILREPYITYLK